MNRLLLIDVDLVVAPSDILWKEWLESRYGYVKTPMTNYNFGVYYPNQDSYSYWKDLDYFSMQPIEGSVEALKKLSNYFGVVFVSAEKCGFSSKNKKSWLSEHYPFKTGYVCTEEKWLMDKEQVKGIIDDRLDNLEKFDYTKRILFKTNYTQTSEAKCNIEFNKWGDSIVRKICKEYL